MSRILPKATGVDCKSLRYSSKVGIAAFMLSRCLYDYTAQFSETVCSLYWEGDSTSSKLVTFRGESVEFVETQVVEDGVTCDVYSFIDDNTKDLGIIRIKQGSQTSKQLILKGDRTIEGFLVGEADLTFSRANQSETIYAYSDDGYGVGTALGVGDTMQWYASEDSVLYEICHPPYEEGRFKEL